MEMAPLEKITVAREYRVAKWLTEGAKSLIVALDASQIEEIAQVLGWETTARLYAAQDASQKTYNNAERNNSLSDVHARGYSTKTFTMGTPTIFKAGLSGIG